MMEYWINWERNATAIADFKCGRQLLSSNSVCGELSKVGGWAGEATLFRIEVSWS